MDYLEQYNIIISKLKDGNEEKFSFTVEDKFFSYYENTIIKGGNIAVELNVLKKQDIFILNLNLEGYVVLTCDRCLDEYDENISFKDEILIKLGDETNFDTDEDFIILDRKTIKINISRFIYESVEFALPLAHIHPKDKNGKSTCNPIMIEKLKKYIINSESEDEEENF